MALTENGSVLVLRTPAGGAEREGGPCKHLRSLALPGLPWVRELCEGVLGKRLRLTPAPELTPCGKEEEVYSGIA